MTVSNDQSGATMPPLELQFQEFINNPDVGKLVGPRWPQYKAKWEAGFLYNKDKIESRSGNVRHADYVQRPYGWNWAAFFFGPFWFFYRKMWIYGAVCAGLFLVAFIAADLLPLPRFGRASSLIIRLAPFVISAKAADSWYYIDIWRRLLRKDISAAGHGVSLLSGILSAIVLASIFVAVGFIEEALEPEDSINAAADGEEASLQLEITEPSYLPHMKVITITNVGSAPVEIRDLTVNNRRDCTEADQTTHAKWVDHIILKVGDSRDWAPLCWGTAIVRVDVTTPAGTQTYTFSKD